MTSPCPQADVKSLLPDWTGRTVLVVAGGSSAGDIVPLVRGKYPTIVVNLAFRLVPEAEIMYAADSGFWAVYRDTRSFRGLKLAPDVRACQYDPEIQVVTIPKVDGKPVNDMIREPAGTIGHGGGNGGFQAVNLAVQTGAKRVLLAGIDYCGPHWHEDHSPALRNPTAQQMDIWRDRFDAQAETLQDWGIEVINLSKVSKLRAYPYEQA